MTTRIDGKAIAQQVRSTVAAEVASTFGGSGSAPGLATILVGDDPASAGMAGEAGRAAGVSPPSQRSRGVPGGSSPRVNTARDTATAAVSALAAAAGACCVRVHDVAASLDAVRVAAAWAARTG